MGESNLIEKIGRIADNIAESYSVAQEKGAIMPETQNSDNLPDTLRSITSGGAAVSVPMKDINFYDYDGTLVASWTLDELAAATELPANPTHAGLTAQGWNWSLDDLKATNRAMNVGQMYITDDGKTRVYITLHEGRTSPMLGCCPNGTVTVDWGDGTTPDTLTGTSTSAVKWTPTHEYAAPGEYVITLTVDGTMGFYGNSSSNQYAGILRHSSGADTRNRAYQNAVQRIEVGNSVTSIGSNAFYTCYSLSSIVIPDSVTSISDSAFNNCYSMRFYDFTKHTSVPALANKNAFTGIPADCEIRVPAALADEWKAATNWATYADYIVGV